ncbi:MFS transporter [Mycobacterium sp. DL440]|uniref:MFS transporter n=1 Tax=Mycobacterium sp. DL440 TaxID=2675523 RepID=UPI001FBAB4A1|nr:MFS transporter [Mycobacterium sp. DL440]
MIGGVCSGRLGPALPLLGGIALGAAATFAMLAGVSVLPLAIACGAMLGMAAGAIGASGYNLATDLVPPERQGTIAGLVSVVLALGSVVVNVAGGEVLKANQAPGTGVDGALVSTATGVHLYVLMAGVLFTLAAVPTIMLTRDRANAPRSTDEPAPGRIAST